MSYVDREDSKMTETTTVQTVDLWTAVDALDASPPSPLPAHLATAWAGLA